MSNAENDTPNDTPESSNGSNGSPKETEDTARSLEHLPDPFLSSSSTPVKTNSFPVLRVEGGNLSAITKAVTEDIAGGLTPEAKEATLHFLQKNAYGFAGALAMKCKGRSCPIVDVCPLAEAGQPLPLNKPCPIEAGIVQVWVNKHLMALGIDDFSAPQNSFDIDLLYELAAHELIKWKAAHHLAQKGRVIEDRQVAANMQGDAIFAEVISPAIEILDIQNRTTMKLKDALLATRKAQIQAGKDMSDPSKKAADLANKAKILAHERLGLLRKEEIEDAEFEEK